MIALRSMLAIAALALASPAVAEGPLSAPRVRAPAYQHPGYVAGRSYAPPFAISNAGSASSATTTYCSPIIIYSRVTIDQLGVYVTTLSAGGLFQLALYSYTPSTNTITLLASSGSASTAATGAINATLSTPVTVNPGLYYGCHMTDNAVAVVLGTSVANGTIMAQMGSSTDVFATGGASFRSSLSMTTTFGTWPASATNPATPGNLRGPALQFRVSAVP